MRATSFLVPFVCCAACTAFGASVLQTDAGDEPTPHETADAATRADVEDAGAADAGDAGAHDGPILGTTTVLNQYWYNAPSGVPASAFQYVANYTGSVTKISVFLDGRTTNGCTIEAGLYSDKNGRPGELLTSGTLGKAKTNDWNSVTVPAVPVTGGRRYWLAFLIPNGGATISFRIAGDGDLAVDSAPDLPALPVTWTTELEFTGSPASAYALP